MDVRKSGCSGVRVMVAICLGARGWMLNGKSVIGGQCM